MTLLVHSTKQTLNATSYGNSILGTTLAYRDRGAREAHEVSLNGPVGPRRLAGSQAPSLESAQLRSGLAGRAGPEPLMLAHVVCTRSFAEREREYTLGANERSPLRERASTYSGGRI